MSTSTYEALIRLEQDYDHNWESIKSVTTIEELRQVMRKLNALTIERERMLKHVGE